MPYSKPVTDIIRARYSCRTYLDQPIAAETRRQLEQALSSLDRGPFGTPLRLQLLAASAEDRAALRGLGTYGFIRGATGFVVGTVQQGRMDMEDFGYGMEEFVLLATDLGLGTCWLGGTFSRSTFAARAALREDERIAAVVALGYPARERRLMERIIRRGAGSDKRHSRQQLFMRERFGRPISAEEAEPYATALEMIRLAPSASNKQPWRVVKDGGAWHFFLQRTPGYGSARLMNVPDLQRVDMGIAMCHWELTAQEMGLAGRWVVEEPAIAVPDKLTQYTASWFGDETKA